MLSLLIHTTLGGIEDPFLCVFDLPFRTVSHLKSNEFPLKGIFQAILTLAVAFCWVCLPDCHVNKRSDAAIFSPSTLVNMPLSQPTADSYLPCVYFILTSLLSNELLFCSHLNRNVCVPTLDLAKIEPWGKRPALYSTE